MAEAEGLRVGERTRPRRSSLDRYQAFVKAVQGFGKVRRLVISGLRPGYVEDARERRRGECLRCGACCAIMFKCPGLKEGNHCSVYEDRPKQCRNFPIDEHDLRYLEHFCGYHFVEREQ